jgi:hypothetical protein
MPIGSQKLFDEAKKSLERIQAFEVDALPRTVELGSPLSFAEAVQPARHLVDLFGRLTSRALEDFPDPTLQQIRDTANSAYNLFDQVLKFDATQANPRDSRQSLINSIQQAYPGTFQALHPFIAYSLHRSADFQQLDALARATLQTVQDREDVFDGQMKEREAEADRVLNEIRKVAAEEGVSQQALHFKAESEHHDTKSEEWRKRTVTLAWVLGGFAVVSLFLHKKPFLKPENAYDAFQLGLSKVLLFAVITYMLVLSARNFMSHRHNAIVNKHRQNALMTHRALIEGVMDSGVRDAVMVQAASCIFSPQPTGYTGSKSDGDASTPRSIVEIMSRASVASAKDAA